MKLFIKGKGLTQWKEVYLKYPYDHDYIRKVKLYYINKGYSTWIEL